MSTISTANTGPTGSLQPSRTRPPRHVSDFVVSVVLVLLVVLTLYPFVFMVITSTKSYSQFLHSYWIPYKNKSF